MFMSSHTDMRISPCSQVNTFSVTVMNIIRSFAGRTQWVRMIQVIYNLSSKNSPKALAGANLSASKNHDIWCRSGDLWGDLSYKKTISQKYLLVQEHDSHHSIAWWNSSENNTSVRVWLSCLAWERSKTSSTRKNSHHGLMTLFSYIRYFVHRRKNQVTTESVVSQIASHIP